MLDGILRMSLVSSLQLKILIMPPEVITRLSSKFDAPDKKISRLGTVETSPLGSSGGREQVGGWGT